MMLPDTLLALALSGQVLLASPQTISSGQTRVSTVFVEAGQVMTGVLDQGEIDLIVTVVAPDGHRLAVHDARERGIEYIAFASETTGIHRLEIRTVGAHASPVAYRLQLDKPRQPTDNDRRRVSTVALHTEAKQLFTKGDHASVRQALDRLGQVLPLWRSLGERAAEMAALSGTGDAHYMLSEYPEAEAVYREALRMAVELGDRRSQAEVLNNLAMVAWPLGRITEALQWLQEALERWQELRFAYGEAIAISNRGILLRESGDYDEARQHYVRALEIFRSIGDRRGEAYVLNNMAQVLDVLGRKGEALRFMDRAVLLFRKSGDTLGEGRGLVRLGRFQLALGRRQRSLATTQLALQLIRRTADRLAEADAENHLGRVFAASTDYARARTQYDRALTLYRAVGSRRGEADALDNIGLTHLQRGEAAQALPYLRQACEIRRAVGLRGAEADTLFLMAEAERGLGALDEARRHLEAALSIAEELRAGLFEEQLRSSFAESKQRFYAAYVDVLVGLHERQPDAGYDRLAFEAVERSRARSLIELLRESWQGVSAVADKTLLSREQALRKEINYWSWRLWQEADKPADKVHDSPARSTLARLMAVREQVEADIRRSDHRYAALFHPEALPLATLQREILDKQTLLLEYALGERRSFVWAVTPDRVTLAQLPGRADIERRSRRFYDRVSAATPIEGAASMTRIGAADAVALSRLLLGPVASALSRRRILVVADGAIQLVPFAALPDTRDGLPLVTRHEIVVLPSASLLALLRRELEARPRATKVLAMFADPVFSATDPRVTGRIVTGRQALVRHRDRHLSRLPHSRDEAQAILSLVPSPLSLRAIDFDANRTVVTGAEIRQYRFVHFATHAVRDDRHPELSGIVLSMVDRAGNPQNGFLRLHDLYNLRLQADLVVLSACETGIGKQVDGEGVSSLARGIFHAGAPRVISSLWIVDDEATAKLMRLFYESLLGPAQMAPAAALRAAQTAMLADKRWQNPYYWSGFILQGDW